MPTISSLSHYTPTGVEAVPCYQFLQPEDGFLTTREIQNLPIAANVQAGVTYTFTTGDELQIVEFTSASSIVCTIPNDSTHLFPTGAVLQACQLGAGRVTFAGAAGVTVRWPKDASAVDCKIARAVNSAVTFRRRAANDWHAVGDLSST